MAIDNVIVRQGLARCSGTAPSQTNELSLDEIVMKLQYELQVAICNVIQKAKADMIRAELTLEDAVFNIGSAIASVNYNQILVQSGEFDCELASILSDDLIKSLVDGYSQKVDLLLAKARDCEQLVVVGNKLCLH